MGCTPSSQIARTNDNETRLLLEIDRLRTGHQSQEQEIDRLRQENEKLKQRDLNGTFEIADTHDNDEKCNLLVKEIERLKLEKEEKDKEINKLRQNNEELNIKLQQSPQVAPVKKTFNRTCDSIRKFLNELTSIFISCTFFCYNLQFPSLQPLATAAAASLETAEIQTCKAKNIPKVGDPVSQA